MSDSLPRRLAIKRALRASAYVVPAVLLSTAAVREMAAVTPAPPGVATGTVNFVASGQGYDVVGTGFPANAPFLVVVADAGGAVVAEAAVHTDSAGTFGTANAATQTAATGATRPAGVGSRSFAASAPLGACPAPAEINGGVAFVALADTTRCIPATLTPVPTLTPTPGRGGPPPGIPTATQTAIAAALTATARARQP
jgi:hypothetical protein